MSRLRTTLLTLAAILMAAPANDASANCRPGDMLCIAASVTVRTPRVHIRIARQAPTYVVQAQAPSPRGRVIVVQPAPPPPPAQIIVQVPQPPPEPRVVVVHQPPPPPEQTVIVVRETPQYAPPPPQPLAPAPPAVTLQPAEERHRRFGLHSHIGGVFGRDVHLGGFAGGLRFRPSKRVGLDFTVGVYGGTDWNGWDRLEVPLSFDTLIYLNPESRMQVYTLFGVGISWSRADDWSSWSSREFTHVGGEVGLGLEWRISRAFALNTDIRGFMRHKIDGSDQLPEFVDAATGDSTNTSAGVLGTFGATVYF